MRVVLIGGLLVLPIIRMWRVYIHKNGATEVKGIVVNQSWVLGSWEILISVWLFIFSIIIIIIIIIILF